MTREKIPGAFPCIILSYVNCVFSLAHTCCRIFLHSTIYDHVGSRVSRWRFAETILIFREKSSMKKHSRNYSLTRFSFSFFPCFSLFLFLIMLVQPLSVLRELLSSSVVMNKVFPFSPSLSLFLSFIYRSKHERVETRFS